MDNLSVVHLSVPSLSIKNCVTITLNEHNYILWKSQFESFLSAQGLLGFVTGEFATPPTSLTIPGINNTNTQTPNPDHQTWRKIDQVIKSWLLGSFSEDLLSLTVPCVTSRDVWLIIAKNFTRVSSSRLFEHCWLSG